ncbi:hypothetical protein [Cysteiniphilum sp. 6C5]|uniref:hypothetical protein n=1 Tax=unclassified Cysteiniphilum TaxID=2610889 RepID=UPI003F850B49
MKHHAFKKQHNLIIALGVLGLFLSIIALPVINVVIKNALFVFSNIFLTGTAIYDKERPFILINGAVLVISLLILINVPAVIIVGFCIVISLWGVIYLFKLYRLNVYFIMASMGFIALNLGTLFNFISFQKQLHVSCRRHVDDLWQCDYSQRIY